MVSSAYGDMYPEARRRCMCCWSDLLGFSPDLHQAKFDSDEELSVAIDRLQLLQSRVIESLMTHEIHLETVMVVNDGVARSLDYIVEHGATFQLNWLARALRTHNAVNAVEMQAKRPGIRSVLVAGERSTHGFGNQTQQDIWSHLDSRDGMDDPSDLFTTEYARRIALYSPFEFQLNLAFAKAYLIESRGTKAGLKGARFFLHESVLEFFDGLPFQDAFKLFGEPVSTVVDVDDNVVAGYRYVRIGPPPERIKWVKPREDVDIDVPIGMPSIVMLLDQSPVMLDGQSVWSVEHFSPYTIFPTMIPLVNGE